jgi:hypothetical protein
MIRVIVTEIFSLAALVNILKPSPSNWPYEQMLGRFGVELPLVKSWRGTVVRNMKFWTSS